MFSSPQHVEISGGQLMNVNGSVHYGNMTLWDRLRQYCALSALLDSKERFDPPKCAEETRVAFIDEVMGWVDSGDEKSALIAWLQGGAGAGKSAIAQTISEILRKEGKLAASFFFSRTSTAERGDGDRLIPTLVFQLLKSIPELKPHVEECLNKHPDLFVQSRRRQMELLFIEPLAKHTQTDSHIRPRSSMPSASSTHTKVSKPLASRRRLLNKIFRVNGEPADPPNRRRFIVIDGLDECNSEGVQIDLLQILADAIPLIQFPFRILIASRSEGYIHRTIGHYRGFQRLDIRHFNLGASNADDDICRFLMQQFQEIHRVHPLRLHLDPSWPPDKAINTIIQKASSHFIYASTAMKYIAYPRSRPDMRLDVILGLSVRPSADKPFAQIDALYSHIFMSLEEHNRATINCILGIIFLAGQTGFGHLETSPIWLEECLDMQAGDIDLLLEPVLSLVALPNNRKSGIKVLHASLFDYLQDWSRSDALRFDLGITHEILVAFCLRKTQEYTLDYQKTENVRLSGNDPITWGLHFLRHCLHASLSDNLQDYLRSCPLLYDVILEPTFFEESQRLEIHQRPVLFIHKFLHLHLEKKIDQGHYWLSVHVAKLEQRFQLFSGPDPRLPDDAHHRPLFDGLLLQSRHKVYRAYLNAVLAIRKNQTLGHVLDAVLLHFGSSRSRIQVKSHLLTIALPQLASEDVQICIRHHILASVFRGGNKELHQVLCQRVSEYLTRIGKDIPAAVLEECKKAWCISR